MPWYRLPYKPCSPSSFIYSYYIIPLLFVSFHSTIKTSLFTIRTLQGQINHFSASYFTHLTLIWQGQWAFITIIYIEGNSVTVYSRILLSIFITFVSISLLWWQILEEAGPYDGSRHNIYSLKNEKNWRYPEHDFWEGPKITLIIRGSHKHYLAIYVLFIILSKGSSEYLVQNITLPTTPPKEQGALGMVQQNRSVSGNIYTKT